MDKFKNEKKNLPVPPMMQFHKKHYEQKQPSILNNFKFETKEISDSVMNYFTFTVEHAGYYKVFNQLGIKCNNDEELNFLQLGICNIDYSDYSKFFNSYIYNSQCQKEHVISNNMSSLKHFEKDTEYICWLCLDSSNNSNFTVQEEFCNLQLIKI